MLRFSCGREWTNRRESSVAHFPQKQHFNYLFCEIWAVSYYRFVHCDMFGHNCLICCSVSAISAVERIWSCVSTFRSTAENIYGSSRKHLNWTSFPLAICCIFPCTNMYFAVSASRRLPGQQSAAFFSRLRPLTDEKLFPHLRSESSWGR